MPTTSSYLTPEKQHQTMLERQLQDGQITATTFSALPAVDQTFVLETLFNQYASELNIYQALSAIEFMLFGFTSIMVEMFPPQATPQSTPQATPQSGLSTEAQALYSKLAEIVTNYNFPISPTTWQIPYLEQQVTTVLQNRAAYFEAKAQVTGTP